MKSISENIGKAKHQINESFRITTTRPVAILMIVIGVFVFGLQSLNRLPLNLMPEISYPSLTVRTEWPGADPEQIEYNISRRIESELAVVSDLTKISSISKNGMSDVILEFNWQTDMNDAIADVRERLDQVLLPEEVERPLILRYDPSLDPIIRIAFFAEVNPDNLTPDEMAMRLRDYADNEIRQKLEAVDGVAAVRIRGGLERELLIEVDKESLESRRLDLNTIVQVVQSNNINLPSGDLREGENEYQVRVVNEYRDIPTIMNLIVARRGGIETRLHEIADVYWHFKEREIYTRVDEQPAVEIDVFKEADANIVSVAQRVHERVYGTEQEQQQARARAAASERGETGPGEPPRRGRGSGLPQYLAFEVGERGWGFSTLTDQSIFIRDSIDEVLQNALWGGLFAIIVLFLFLRNLKSTILIGLSIPISVIATFAPMMLFGVSLNIMSLGGLALGIGMLVDSSIVVLESIFRCTEEGDSLIDAVIRGTSEVGGAVIASTLTTIAVFFPIVFVVGVAGQIFGDLSLAVVFSLLASLLCALFFIPMLASRRLPQIDVQKGMGIGRWQFPAARSVKDRIKARWDSAEGFFGKSIALAALVPLSILWAVLAIPGVAYDLLLRRGNSLELLRARLGNFWSRSQGLLGALPLKIILFAPHHLFFLLVFAVDVVLDLLGRNFKSVGFAGERLRRFWRREPGLLKLLWKVVKFIPVHLYLFLVFGAHFLFELVGRLLSLLLLVLFKAFRGAAIILGGFFAVVLWAPLWVFSRFLNAINNGYGHAIHWALRFKFIVIALALLLAFHAGSLFYNLKSELIPEVHQGEFNVRIKAPVGTDIERTNEITAGVESAIRRALAAGAQDGDSNFYETIATVVGAERSSSTRSDEGENTAVVTVRLKPSSQITGIDHVIAHILRTSLRSTPEVEDVSLTGPGAIAISAPGSAASGNGQALVNQIRQRARLIPGVIEVSSNGQGSIAVRTNRVVDVKGIEELAMFAIRTEVSYIPGISATTFDRPILFSFKTPVEVEVKGQDLARLADFTNLAYEMLSNPDQVPGLTDVKSSVQSGNPTLDIQFDKDRLNQLGMSERESAQKIRDIIEGATPTKFREEDRQYDIRIRFRRTDINSIDEVHDLNLRTTENETIPLSDLARIRTVEGPAEIRRINQERTGLITANLLDTDLGTANERIDETLSTRINWLPDYTFEITGQTEEMEVSLNSLQWAMALAVFLVYIVMASQFESLIQPFIIIFTIPLALIGVIYLLVGTGTPVSIVVLIGVIMLAGIVVNNAIVLVDYINKLRQRGIEKTQAIIEAGKVRLRPILMTTMTTVLGLMPLALGLGAGTEIRSPMAWTVIAGLLSSTLLTLIVIPTVYALVDRRTFAAEETPAEEEKE